MKSRGSRGPRKTPIAILKLHGSRRAEGRVVVDDDDLFYKELPKTPTHLKGEAADFYKWAGKLLVAQQNFALSDFVAFVLMCEEYGQYRQAAKHCDPPVIKAKSGNLVKSPWVQIRDRSLAALKRSMKSFFMLPSHHPDPIGKKPAPDPFAALSKPGRKKEPEKGPYSG